MTTQELEQLKSFLEEKAVVTQGDLARMLTRTAADQEVIETLFRTIFDFVSEWNEARKKPLRKFFIAVSYLDDFEKIFTEIYETYERVKIENKEAFQVDSTPLTALFENIKVKDEDVKED